MSTTSSLKTQPSKVVKKTTKQQEKKEKEENSVNSPSTIISIPEKEKLNNNNNNNNANSTSSLPAAEASSSSEQKEGGELYATPSDVISHSIKQSKTAAEPNELGAKYLVLFIAALFLFAGVFMLTAQDAALMDWFYDDEYPLHQRTATIFLDGYVCFNGNCTPPENNYWICDKMANFYREERRLVIATGIINVIICLLIFVFTVGGKLFDMLFYDFVRRCCCKAGVRATRSWGAQKASSFSRTVSLAVGVMLMVASLGMSIKATMNMFVIIGTGLCDYAPNNQSLNSKPHFTYGRSTKLVAWASLMSWISNGLLLFWFCGFVCVNINKYDGDDQEEFFMSEYQQDGGVGGGASGGSSSSLLASSSSPSPSAAKKDF